MLIKMDEKKVSLFLRLGIAFTFIYVGFAAFANPNAWIGFIPEFVDNIIARSSFLKIHAVFDLLLGVWLLSNWKIFYASVVSALFLFGIVVFNLGALDIIFRDIGLFFAAVALVYLSK